jgi:hypothetical protein
MIDRHVMDAAEGAAWGYQLDCMIKVLDQIDDRAAEVGDEPVLRLIRCLYEAREAATQIETRTPPPPLMVVALADKPQPTSPMPARRGVNLAKR